MDNSKASTSLGWFSDFLKNCLVWVLEKLTRLALVLCFLKLFFKRLVQGFKSFGKNIFTQVSKFQVSHILDPSIFKGSFHTLVFKELSYFTYVIFIKKIKKYIKM